jgi:hypothetical protein
MPDLHLSLERREDEELAGLARASRADVAKGSLAVLARREAPGVQELARELLRGHADERVRAMSAVTLGRDARPESHEALLGALNDADPLVVRRAAQALAKVGGEQALTALGRVQPPAGSPEGRDVRASRMLLSYRLGIPEVLVAPTETTTFASRRPEEITFGGRSPVSRDVVLASVRRALPGVNVVSGGVRTFTCSGRPGAVALDGDLASSGFAGPRLLGALLRERVCSETRFSLDLYLLSDDRDGTGGARPRLWLVRPSGRVVHAGYAEVTEGRATFTVTESVAPYGNPIKVTGTCELASGKLTIDEAQVGKPSVRAAKAAEPPTRDAVMRRR